MEPCAHATVGGRKKDQQIMGIINSDAYKPTVIDYQCSIKLPESGCWESLLLEVSLIYHGAHCKPYQGARQVY